MHRQNGLTLVGTLFVVAGVICVSILTLKVAPVYVQHYTIVGSAKALSTIDREDLSANPSLNVSLLKDQLKRQFYINQVDESIMDGVKIHMKKNYNYIIEIEYQQKRHLLSNISLLFDFKDKIEVSIGQNKV